MKSLIKKEITASKAVYSKSISCIYLTSVVSHKMTSNLQGERKRCFFLLFFISFVFCFFLPSQTRWEGTKKKSLDVSDASFGPGLSTKAIIHYCVEHSANCFVIVFVWGREKKKKGHFSTTFSFFFFLFFFFIPRRGRGTLEKRDANTGRLLEGKNNTLGYKLARKCQERIRWYRNAIIRTWWDYSYHSS